MSPFLTEIGKKLADRWLTTAVFPGLLFLAVAAAGTSLGQRTALDWHDLGPEAGRWVLAVSRWTAAGDLLALVLALFGSVVAGLAGQAGGELVQRIWQGDWPRWAEPAAARLVARRQARWDALQNRLAAGRGQAPPGGRPADLLRSLDAIAARRDRIGQARPSRPTFIGDRLTAAATRTRNQYGVDLASCWIRLWLVLPEDVRTELRAARTRLDAAATTSAWAICYAALAVLWWPSALVALVVAFAGWRRGRLAAADNAELVESTVDVHLRRLAVELGLTTPDQPLDTETGARLTRMIRKGA